MWLWYIGRWFNYTKPLLRVATTRSYGIEQTVKVKNAHSPSVTSITFATIRKGSCRDAEITCALLSSYISEKYLCIKRIEKISLTSAEWITNLWIASMTSARCFEIAYPKVQ